MIVAKFGGSSLADAEQFKKVKNILWGNHDRRVVVPSAPGSRFTGDKKVTDLLLSISSKNADFEKVFAILEERFTAIASQLELKLDIDLELSIIKQNVIQGASIDYVLSRGEYLCGRMLADYLGWAFIDARDVVRFSSSGVLDPDTTVKLMKKALSKEEYAVIPGFYGSDERGNICVFSRGGSDITGALAANAVNADLYENWTDVTGVRMADPRIVPDAKFVSSLTYRELRELSYMGASVLHEDAVFPVHRAGIPTNIRNTNVPDHPGTLISSVLTVDPLLTPVTGIAGKKGFTIISIEKDMMNAELGFGRRVLQVLESFNVNFEHLPTGIDAMSIVVSEKDLAGCKEALLEKIREAVQPDSLSVHDSVALIATVGRGMSHAFGTAARLLTAVTSMGIPLRIIDQGYDELSIIIGVDEKYYEDAINAIYNTFVRT